MVNNPAISVSYKWNKDHITPCWLMFKIFEKHKRYLSNLRTFTDPNSEEANILFVDWDCAFSHQLEEATAPSDIIQ